MGTYGGYKYCKRTIYAFYLWAIVRCVMAAMDALFAWIYLFVLGLWIYWTVIIKRYYRMLQQQQILNRNNDQYTRYDNDQFDSNNPYVVTNEGV